MTIESWALDGLEFNASGLRIVSATVPPASKRPTWLDSPDADGSLLLEDPRVGPRVLTFGLRYDRATDMDTALSSLGDLVDKLEACGKAMGGLPLVWTPNTSSKSTTFRALLAEITDLPLELGGSNHGWFVNGPVCTVVITCAPFGELDLVTGEEFGAEGPLWEVVVAGADGDAPALTSLTVLEQSSTDVIRFIEAGAGPDTNSPLMLTADADLVTTGFAGAKITDATAISGSSIQTGVLLPQVTAVCGTGPQPHVGTWRVLARVQMHSTGRARLSWRVGDGDYTANAYAAPVVDLGAVAGGWCRMDFGLITIPSAAVGDQAWDGRIEALDTGFNGINVDSVFLIPVDAGYFIARAAYRYQAGAVVGYDSFVGTTATSALGTRTAPAGGSWATSGDTTDWKFDDIFNIAALDTVESIERNTNAVETTGRYAILGSTSYTDVQVDARMYWFSTVFASKRTDPLSSTALVARWTDSSNHLRFIVPSSGSQTRIEQVTAGATTILATSAWVPAWAMFSPVPYGLRLIAFATGRVIAQAISDDGTILAQLEGGSSDLATGGTLATGKIGARDQCFSTSAASSRRITDFVVSVPAAEPVIAYPDGTFVIDGDGARRLSDDASTWGRVTPIGVPLVVQPRGDAGIDTHVVVLSHPHDLGANTWDVTAPAFACQVDQTPRVRVVPR